MSKNANNNEINKPKIFKFFFGKQQVASGGSVKTKMRRNKLSYDEIEKMKNIINELDNDKLKKYFNDLMNRDSNLAPPPEPSG